MIHHRRRGQIKAVCAETTLISVSRRVIFGRDNKTTTLLCTFVDGLDDIDELLLIFQDPIKFVVVTSTKIAHHVFVAEEEHDGDRIVEFVHLLEVGHLIEVADIYDGEVLDPVCNLVEHFILTHAIWIPVAAEADYDETFVFSEDGLVDVPGGDKMRDDYRTHLQKISYVNSGEEGVREVEADVVYSIQ